MSTESSNATAANFIGQIAGELKLTLHSVVATAQLLAEGATVPFIARYRKEVTGSLDEVAITNIRDRMAQLLELEARRSAIVKSLDERKVLTPELQKKITAALTMTALEDAFAPYRPKRRTRATMAREKGLEPLANWLVTNQSLSINPIVEAAKFVVASDDKDKAVSTTEEALTGARDILAERFTDDPETRRQVRALFTNEAVISTKVLIGEEAKPEAAKFRDYFAWSEPLAKCPSHRILAMRRGEAEGPLLMRITVDEAKATALVKGLFVKGAGPAAQQVALACEDGYKRLLSLSLETDARLAAKKTADIEASIVVAAIRRTTIPRIIEPRTAVYYMVSLIFY